MHVCVRLCDCGAAVQAGWSTGPIEVDVVDEEEEALAADLEVCAVRRASCGIARECLARISTECCDFKKVMCCQSDLPLIIQ